MRFSEWFICRDRSLPSCMKCYIIVSLSLCITRQSAARRQHHSVHLLKDLRSPFLTWQSWLVFCHKAIIHQQPSYLTCLLSPYIDSCVSSTSDLLSTQSSWQTLLLVSSYAAPPPFGTVFPHLYALLTVSVVLGLSSKCSQDIFSWYTVHACLGYPYHVLHVL